MSDAAVDRNRRARERGVLACGVAALALGVATHEWVVTELWASPAFLEGPERRLAFHILSVAGLLIGGVLILLRRAIAARLVPLLAMGITLAGVLGLFLAADLFLGYRLMSPGRHGEEPALIHDPDERLGWVTRPGAVARHRLDGNFDVEYRIDAEGFREIPYNGTPERRLWVFGDSYTFGYGVENEEAWPAVLARDHLTERIRVVNAGVNGYGLIQMYGRLQDVADRLGPDDVVLFAPIAKDLLRNLHDFEFAALLLFGNRGPSIRFPRFEGGVLRGVSIDRPWNRVRGLFLHALVSEGLFRFVNRAITGPASIAEAHAILAAARALCAAREVDFALVFLPQLKEIRRGRYAVDVASFDYLDLRRFLPADAETLDRLRFPTNAHWNRDGHAVAAHAVVRALTKPGFLEAGDLRGR